jgi:hypothetical protein
MMEAESTTLAAIRTSLLSLADYVASAQLRIPRPETPRVERTRDEVAWAIREYLVPRLDDPLAPAVAVVAGPGGAGKSAILNAIARRTVSPSGVMRPTTTEPIVWGPRSRPESDWRVFLHRLREQTGAELDVVMGDDPLTEHVIFVDTPPVDLVRADGRIPALEALGLADICIFVTSASRYADASGWMYLEAARRRGVPILHVINRLPRDPDAAEEVLIDYVARLHGRDLLMEPDTSLVFPVVSGEIDAGTGGPSAAAVGALRGELAELAHSDFRSAIINQTVLATTHAVAQRARRVGAELAVEVQERADFDEAVATAYREQSRALVADLEAGRLAELASAESWGLAAADLTGIVTRRAGVAAQETTQSWEERPGGRELLGAGGEGLRRHGQDTAYEAQRTLEQWYTLAGEHAAAAGKRTRMWKRTQRRVQKRLWPQVLDPGRAMDRSLTRRYGTAAEGLVTTIREDLGTALTAALAADAERFERFLGPQPDSAILREIETRAEWIEALVEDEVELVPISSHSAQTDAGEEANETEANLEVADGGSQHVQSTSSDDGETRGSVGVERITEPDQVDTAPVAPPGEAVTVESRPGANAAGNDGGDGPDAVAAEADAGADDVDVVADEEVATAVVQTDAPARVGGWDEGGDSAELDDPGERSEPAASDGTDDPSADQRDDPDPPHDPEEGDPAPRASESGDGGDEPPRPAGDVDRAGDA